LTGWLDYVDARRRMIHEWYSQGIEAFDMALRFEIDVEHVERIIRQPADPPLPGTARAQVIELRKRVAELERELHRRDSLPPPPPGIVPTTSQIRALLSNPDPALCGCAFFKPDAETGVASDEHHPECPFAGKR